MIGNLDRKPIVLVAKEPITQGQVDDLRAYLASFPWPVLVVDHRWEVLT